ncbi:MAG: preprotein translocase subunit YajC [Treponema sp.]
MSFVPFLQSAGSASTTGGFLSSAVLMVLLIVIFYFFLIRPQNKKQKETEKMLAALKKGDKVVTIGGIHGVISSLKEKTVIVKVDDNVKLEFSRSAISGAENEPAVNEKSAKDKKSSDNTASVPAETSEEKK